MWICLNDAFLSIVTAPQRSSCLLVRARVKGHIERVFPEARVLRTSNRDYLYRAFVPRTEVGRAISKALREIAYGNFKDSVEDPALHRAYGDFWHTMMRLQVAADRDKDPDSAWRDFDHSLYR